MSDTPRTDAECGWYDPNGIRYQSETGDHVDPDFARQLERELNAANERIRRLEEAALQVYIDSIASDHPWTYAETRNMHALRDVLEEPKP